MGSEGRFARVRQRELVFVWLRRVPQRAQLASGYRLVQSEVVAAEDANVFSRQFSLQTCTLPDYSKRLIIQAELKA